MDGWESRRKRQYAESSRQYPDYDSAIIRLGLRRRARVRGRYRALQRQLSEGLRDRGREHRGPPGRERAHLRQGRVDADPSRVDLEGDSKNLFAVDVPQRPRISASTSTPTAAWLASASTATSCPARAGWGVARPQLVDLAAAEHGGLRRLLQRHVLRLASQPDHARARREHGRRLGDEALSSGGPGLVVVRLATEWRDRASHRRHTLHFKGNAPDACAIDICRSATDPRRGEGRGWGTLLEADAPPASPSTCSTCTAATPRTYAFASGRTAASVDCGSWASRARPGASAPV